MDIVIPRHALQLLLGALVGIAGIANADPPSPHYCEVAMELSLNGRSVAVAPGTIVEFGKEAEITLSRDGMTGWQFRILADEPNVVRRASAVPVDIAIYELVNGEPVLRATPHLRIALGQRADLDTTFGEEDGRKAHIALVVNLRSDADVEAQMESAKEQPL
jgi:hypothetical protein